jgi:sugar lactone lactonase YvrE
MLLFKHRAYFVYLIFLSFILSHLPVQASDMPNRTLVKGADFQGANGIRVSPMGLLYVTSAVGSRIDVLEPRSGKRLMSLGQEQGVYGPDDLAFGPDGLLYWTAFFTGEVMRLNADGLAEMVARVGPGVNAISFSADGRLFVSRVFLADELYEIDPLGMQPPRLVKQELGGLNAMDFGPDGYLYGPLWFKGQIARIDVDTGELEVVAGGLRTPAAVKYSPDGVLHVLDQHQGTLLTVDQDTGEKPLSLIQVRGLITWILTPEVVCLLPMPTKVASVLSYPTAECGHWYPVV